MHSIQRVTDAEWMVMRALWEKPGSSAADVFEALKASKEWRPTTVKTFLSRLAEKKLISFEKTGKTFWYSPLVSEQECVVSEMKAVLNRVYGGIVRFESEHFQFFGIDNPALSHRLSEGLEKMYEHIEVDFDYRLEEKQMVYLYSSLNRLHSALGVQNGPQWLRAGWKWDILHIGPAEEFTDLSIESATAHVFIQRVTQEINPDAPYWLHQGIATHESGWLIAERLSSAIDRWRGDLRLDTILSLKTKYDLFRFQGGYELSYTLVDFILLEFGKTALLSFLRHPQDYEGTFSCQPTEFWSRWINFVQTHYLTRTGDIE